MKKEKGFLMFLKKRKGINGIGLFTTTPIKKGEFIIEYKGKLLTTKEADEKGGQYLFEINKNWTIDGTSRKNTARYINHSCKPNCETETLVRKKQVKIFSIANIKAGEELTYNYGKSFWREYIEPKGCCCAKCKKNK